MRGVQIHRKQMSPHAVPQYNTANRNLILCGNHSNFTFYVGINQQAKRKDVRVGTSDCGFGITQLIKPNKKAKCFHKD